MNYNKKNNITGETLKKRFKEFARYYIADRPNLHQQVDFPDKLWAQMRREKLFGTAIDTNYQGHGHRIWDLLPAGKAIVEYGGNMGVALSWLLHELTAGWLISGFGNHRQKSKWLPSLAAGKATACFAVSEPKAGAHPKNLSTRAKKATEGYILNGEKTYLTNGPIADFFIVIAGTGQISGKNRFSAFIVPANTPGLTITAPMVFPFLRPCPHGGILLDNCLISAEHLLGTPDDAYEKMVRPFRAVEDALMLGPVMGGLFFLYQQCVSQFCRRNKIPDPEPLMKVAQLKCVLDALAAIAETSGKIIGENHDHPKLLTLGVFFRAQALQFLEKIQQMFEQTGMPAPEKTKALINDILTLMRMGDNISKIKLAKLGTALFSNPPKQGQPNTI